MPFQTEETANHLHHFKKPLFPPLCLDPLLRTSYLLQRHYKKACEANTELFKQTFLLIIVFPGSMCSSSIIFGLLLLRWEEEDRYSQRNIQLTYDTLPHIFKTFFHSLTSSIQHYHSISHFKIHSLHAVIIILT